MINIRKILLKISILVIPNCLYKHCFQVSDFFYHLGDVLIVKKNKIHPKHQITKYSTYFLKRISKNHRVIDLGCGIGVISYLVAKKAKNVLAIDSNNRSIEKAKRIHNLKNLEFKIADIYNFTTTRKFDFAILSNVLEHLETRPQILFKIRKYAKGLLLRVPNIERDWYTVYKKNVGWEYRSDLTHTIEHDFKTLKSELAEGGWRIIEASKEWGEIWCFCVHGHFSKERNKAKLP